MSKKYSICITCFNNVETVERSFKSILSQLDDRFEVVVVDSFSTDGSFEVLSELSHSGQIKMVTQKCNRGLGRQVAFQNSTGEYVIANLDTDDFYLPYLRDLIDCYHKKCEGNVLLATAGNDKGTRGAQNITIGPRAFLEELGGWHSLQWGEDWDLWCRAAKRGRYSWTSFKLLERINLHPERTKLVKKIRMRYIKYRELMRVGRDVFQNEEKIGITQRAVYFLAKLSLPFQESYFDNFSKTFDSYSRDYYIDLSREIDYLMGQSSVPTK